MIAITGNTYPVKEQLKRLGGRWNAKRKAWMVPDDKADEAQSLVPERTWKQRHGRCEDAPCCGCCGPQGDGDYYGYHAEESRYG